MNGRTDIGVGIKLIELCHELCEKIDTGKLNGAQLLTGGVNQIGKQGSREGNGIGLSIVKRIVELHSGKISVISKDGLTTFTVSLPKTI